MSCYHTNDCLRCAAKEDKLEDRIAELEEQVKQLQDYKREAEKTVLEEAQRYDTLEADRDKWRTMARVLAYAYKDNEPRALAEALERIEQAEGD